MTKPLPRRIPSDTCPVLVQGTIYYPHEGEWIELIPTETIADLQERIELDQMLVQLQALEGEEGGRIKQGEIVNARFPQLCALIARVVLDWTWTDFQGLPMENPHGKPEVVAEQISTEELIWLWKATQPEVPAERKNGSKPSPTSSSATGSPTNRKSERVRSHTRR